MAEHREPQDLERALVRALPRRSARGASRWAFWKRPDVEDTVAETFEYVFALLRETLGVEDEDLELGNVHFSRSRQGVDLYYYVSDVLVSASCAQAGKRLDLTHELWKGSRPEAFKVSKDVRAERPKSTLNVSARRSSGELWAEDCAALRAIFEAACRIVGSEEDPSSGS